MVLALLIWLASTFAGKLVGVAAKWATGKLFGKPLDEVTQAVESAIESARIKFHEYYAHDFGSSGSTFIDRERNRRALIRTTFPSGQRLAENDIDPRGFDGASDASAEAVKFFLQSFYHALDQTKSRDLERDRALQDTNRNMLQVGIQLGDMDEKLDKFRREQALPDPVRAAIAQPHLDELTELMKAGRAQEAFNFAIQHTEKIDAALTKENDPQGVCAEALRAHRQRLLFAAASAASWLGNRETGRTCWHRARNLGPIDPEYLKQAADALFNVGLADDLRHIVSQMDPTSEAYHQTILLLAFLDEDWQSVDKQLTDAKRGDLLLMRAHARIQIIDPQDVKAVQITADLIDQTEGDDYLETINLSLAQVTFNLLKRVVEEYTPLDYNRRPLVDNLTRRVIALVEATQSDSPLQTRVLGILADTANLLHDEVLDNLFGKKFEALDTEARSRVFFRYDSPPTPEKIAEMLDSGQIESSKATILKVAYYNSQRQPDEAERILREALFSTSDVRQRAHVLRLLTRHLRRQKQDDEAQRLIEEIPLRPSDRWLLRAENLPKGSLPADMINEIEDFPLDVDVLAWLAQSRLRLAFPDVTSPEDIPDSAVDIVDAAVEWAARLVEVLPSRSYRLLYAEALHVARRYNDLLAACQDIDPIYSEYAVELQASALKGLGRISEAADSLTAALADYPDSERIAVNASALLLAENRPAEAAQILEPLVQTGTAGHRILVNFSQSLLAQHPRSQEHASYAFDLLEKAYDLHPDLKIAGEAWMAARGANREREARRFFAAMTEEIPHATVRTAEDIDEILRTENQVFVHLEGGVEALVESMRRDQERADRLNRLSNDHLLAYSDLFRLGGRPWEHWTHWTQQFKRLKAEDPSSIGAFSILADWPSAAFVQADRPDHRAGVLADMTAILTLGILGPNIARQILAVPEKIHVQEGTLNDLREEKNRIEASLQLGRPQRYVDTARILRGMDDAIIPYTEEIKDAAPDAPALGAYRVDIGAAIFHNALYVTDMDGVQEWPDEIRQRTISSGALLASLNAAGVIPLDEARHATKRNPDIFGGWETIESHLSIPATLVFSEFTLMDWMDTNLVGALGNRLKVGPLAWTHTADEAQRRESLDLAHERLQEVITILQEAADTGEIVEIEEFVDGAAPLNGECPPEENSPPLETAWSYALRSLRTAQKHGLQLWADDRFYPLLLGPAGPTVKDREIEAIRKPFAAWADMTPPISTMGLLDRLSKSGHLPHEVAQDATAALFAQGYRMAHPILLGYALRQFHRALEETPLARPFQEIVDAIAEIPHYLPDTIDSFHRAGLLRLASAKITGRLIEYVWQTTDLSNDQRRLLADAFLDALEGIFEHESATSTASRSDRTALLFWMEISKTLQLIPVHDSASAEIKNAGLHWLGDAAARRAKQRQDIVRLLEDNMLTFIGVAMEACEEKDQLPQIVRAFVTPSLIQLTGTELINKLDPLLRRTLGTLIGFSRGGRIDILYNVKIPDKNFQITVSEEDNERAAADVLRRIAAGDMMFAQMVYATDVVFSYQPPNSEEWINAEDSAEVQIPIDVRCSLFTLLWADPPDLRTIIVGIIIRRLAPIDPVLTHRVIQLEADLTCDDPKKSREARDKLAIDVLRSGYFDLQRDLAHAVWRFRNYNTDTLSRFIGGIGEEAANALANHPSVENTYQIDALFVPLHHRIARSLLTDRFNDEAFILEAVEKMTNPADGSNNEKSVLPSLADWLANRALMTETTDDPFIAAWALHQILLVLSTIGEDPQLDINGRTISTSKWAIGYLETALTVETEQPSALEQQMATRKQLVSATLQLAAFACGGEKHFEAYNTEEDPLTEWLDHVWLLTSKLQIALVGLEGGPTGAAAAATTAVQKLGLATPSARALDAFDPFAFGSEGDDIEAALTLTVILKVLHKTEVSSHPPWWTKTIQDCIENFAATSPSYTEDIGNRLGLIAPFRVHILARKILEIVSIND